MGRSESGFSASPSRMVNLASTSLFFVPRTTPGAQTSNKSTLKRNEKEEVDKLVGRYFLWNHIPFSIAKRNPFYQPKIDVIGIVGPSYKAPSYDELRKPTLQNKKANCNAILEEFRASWERNCLHCDVEWLD